MIAPDRCRLSTGATTCMHSMAPNRLVSNIRRQAAMSMRSTESISPKPALFTHTSTRPKRSMTAASRASICARTVTSQATARVLSRTLLSAAPARCRAASTRPRSREASTTLAPSRRKRPTMASPIPIEAPVTTTTLPVIFMPNL